MNGLGRTGSVGVIERRFLRSVVAVVAVVLGLGGVLAGAVPAQAAAEIVADTIDVHEGAYDVAVSPDGGTLYVAAAGPDLVLVVDTETNSVVDSISVGAHPHALALSSDGDRLYVANRGMQMSGPLQTPGSVSVVDTQTRAVDSIDMGLGNTVLGVAVSPDGSTVYATVSGVGLSQVAVIRTEDNTVSDTIETNGRPEGVAVAPDGSKVCVTVRYLDSLLVIDPTTNEVSGTVFLGEDAYPTGVAVSPDGSTAYVTNWTPGTLSVVDTASGTVIATVGAGSWPSGVAVSPDGSSVYAVSNGSGIVSVIDAETNEVTATIGVGKTPWGVAVSPDGFRTYVANIGSSSVSVLTPSPTVPGVATGLSAVAGDTEVDLSWDGPVGSWPPVSDYVVEFSGDKGDTWTEFSRDASAETSATVTGLTNGTEYSFRVSAVNSVSGF